MASVAKRLNELVLEAEAAAQAGAWDAAGALVRWASVVVREEFDDEAASVALAEVAELMRKNELRSVGELRVMLFGVVDRFAGNESVELADVRARADKAERDLAFAESVAIWTEGAEAFPAGSRDREWCFENAARVANQGALFDRLEAVAQSECRVETLRPRGSDSLDLPEVSVLSLWCALRRAHELGEQSRR